MESRYWAWIFPKPRRPFPRRRREWWRFALVVVLLLGAGTAYAAHEQLYRLATCNDGWPSTDAWDSSGRCIGLSSGPYAFGLPAFEQVMGEIDAQNRAASEQCHGTGVTVGVLMAMTAANAGSRALHELEGMAAGQHRANGTGCIHPMKLLIGQLGDYDDPDGALAVAKAMAERPEVVAVAGIGLSDPTTAKIANLLAEKKIPVISDVVTAEGFDQDGSKADDPSFEQCDSEASFAHGIGRDYLYRIGFRVAVQVSAIGAVSPGKPDVIAVPTGRTDPYTCTTLPLLHRRYGDVSEMKFDDTEPATVTQTARSICATQQPITVVYVARGRDLGRLIYGLDELVSRGQCPATSITVLSTSDGNRLRTQEFDPGLEDIRKKAVTAHSFQDGRIRLLFTLVAGTDGPRADNPNWPEFNQAFLAAGFLPAHIGDGWAINAYDAVTTVDTALRLIPTHSTVRRSELNSVISGFKKEPVPGAEGPITFDNSGNRTGALPLVVRLCPAKSGTDATDMAAVEAIPGAPIPECPPLPA
ncbi:ABC transporter substrate-binding protein [Nocardia concava]|uniref:ABC transporter substrate-binding protein n=1 Tax=Nocardia concava TaxID=257281 RepID=UPI0012FCA9BB|nr:ABC transporter substrate-binding protein [Nocardia concava]